MINWPRLRRAASRHGLKGVLVRTPAHLSKALLALLRRRLDAIRSSYSTSTEAAARSFLPNDLDWSDPSQIRTVSGLAELYLDHRFDLLGSGWLRMGYGAESPGFEGHCYRMPPQLEGGWPAGLDWPAATRREARRLQGLVSPGYQPIDWHRDHKSGYRWRTGLHVTEDATAPAPGVDVKMPWELSRMQHLPVLAHAYALEKAHDPSRADRLLREIESQILDFISSNPPRLGVNWQCTMDVGIRVANWVFTAELLRVRGAKLREEFSAVLVRSVYEHARHIIEHLEFSPSQRGNHYLANIAGLVFAAAFLPAGPESDAWLAFGIQELTVEVAYQFHQDGSGFEGSIPYHALSLDLVLWTAWLIEVLGPEYRPSLARHLDVASSVPRSRPLRALGVDTSNSRRLPATTWERLGHAVQFLSDVTRPDGTIPQIGDNDSGRFFRLSPRTRVLSPAAAREIYYQLPIEGVSGMVSYLDELSLDRQPLTAFGAILTGQTIRSADPLRSSPESRLASVCCTERRTAVAESVYLDVTEALSGQLDRLRSNCGPPFVTRFEVTHTPTWRQELRFVAYHGMGIYVWRSPLVFLLIRCGEVGQQGRGGHAHNDQLGLELIINGTDRVVDPGTYVYTADTELRNQYRSASAHFVPSLSDGEQNLWPDGADGLFLMKSAVAGTVHIAGMQGFIGRFSARNESVWRVVRLQEDGIVVEDFCAHPSASRLRKRTLGYGRQVRR